MSTIIRPPSAAQHPLAALSVFGHLQFGNYSVGLGSIVMVEHHESGDVRIRLITGEPLELIGNDARAFLDAINDLAMAALRQINQSGIVAVPPGTRIANH